MKRAIAAAAVVLATLAAIATRTLFEGRAALADGDALAARGDVRGAIAAWETAARWYLPGASHVDAAYVRLQGIADHDPAHALAAWRAVRGAALATRSWWTPHAEDLAAADKKIAELSADDPERATALDHAFAAANPGAGIEPAAGAVPTTAGIEPAAGAVPTTTGIEPAAGAVPTTAGIGSGATAARDARVAWHQAQLARDDRPGTGAAMLAIAGMCGFLGGIALLVLRGIGPTGILVRRPALLGAAIATLGAAGWVAGL